MSTNPLTSARVFDKRTDVELAQWLDNDADQFDGRAGMNNHIAACRAAAERLRSNDKAWEDRHGETGL